jgi:hypothetical protein
LKIPNTHIKRAGGVAQGIGPEFKPQYSGGKQKGKKKEKIYYSEGSLCGILKPCEGLVVLSRHERLSE